ncbi:S-layer homology domain-containing protein [Leptolyngbya sp. AN03gr2]|uniref:S-layer homology domain-containing protein n=1 Tax=unclassified Leptolyngbya TaxID=2650499 RepID=UPI003D30F19D
MIHCSDRFLFATAGVVVVAGTTIIAALEHPVNAQNAAPNFPDTQNHWAQPFIQALAARNIVSGYPDGTFRPEQAVRRDEFSSIVKRAFNQPAERQIESGSTFQDVPQGYWAEDAIREAYQTGFVSGNPNGDFRPRQPISRADALVALSRNLPLQNAAQPGNPQSTSTAPPAQTPQQRRAARPQMLPLAATTLLQPFITPVAQARAAIQPGTQSPAQAQSPQNNQQAAGVRPASEVVQYYQDADRIPADAVDAVAEATRARVVVNHPDTRVLNPTQPTTRGAMAAFIHQALVSQGAIQPLDDSTQASQYIVQQR